jgi:hypothetical protein
VTSQPEVGREKDKKKKVLRDQEVGRKENVGTVKPKLLLLLHFDDKLRPREREPFLCARVIFKYDDRFGLHAFFYLFLEVV